MLTERQAREIAERAGVLWPDDAVSVYLYLRLIQLGYAARGDLEADNAHARPPEPGPRPRRRRGVDRRTGDYWNGTHTYRPCACGDDRCPYNYVPARCEVPPPGWTCTRTAGHDGPCAAWSTP